MRNLVFIAALLLSSISLAETLSATRSRYLARPLTTSVSIEVPKVNLEFRPNARGAESTHYEPNSHILVGVGLEYKGVGATISVQTPQSAESSVQKGRTNHFDLILHRRWSESALDLMFETYRGFYLAGSREEDSNAPYLIRSDIATRHIGANYHAVFSPESYKIRVDSEFDEAGSHSGGSWLSLASIDHNRFSADRPFIETSAAVVGAEFLSSSLGIGYGYFLKRNRHGFRGQLGVGFGPQWRRVETAAGPVNETVGLAMKANGLFNYTYTQSGYAFGINAVVDEVASKTSELEVTANIISALLFARTEF